MPDFIKYLSTLQHNAELTRSDVLRALMWPISGLLFAILVALRMVAPDWILIALFVLLVIFMFIYGGFYIFFACTDPDALRSEKYKLQKMAIEHGLYGDSTIGMIDPKNTSPLLEGPKPITEASDG